MVHEICRIYKILEFQCLFESKLQNLNMAAHIFFSGKHTHAKKTNKGSCVSYTVTQTCGVMEELYEHKSSAYKDLNSL